MTPNSNHLLQKAIHEIQANHLEAGKLLLEEVLRLEVDQPDALRFLGIVAAMQKDWIKALQYVDSALQIHPQNGIAHSNRGNILTELGRNNEALISYDTAIKLQPDYAEAYGNKGNALQALGRHQESLVCYAKAIELQSSSADIYCNQGNALQALGQLEEALISYEKAVEYDPKHALAFYGVARLFYLQKQYDYALGCCDQALNISPQSEPALSLKASILFNTKDYQNAIATYDQLLLLNPNASEAWISKGGIYFEIKDFGLSKDALQKAFDINPHTDFLLGTMIQNDLQMCAWDPTNQQVKKLIEGVKEGKKVAIPYNFISLLDDKKLIRRSIEIYAQSLKGDIERKHQKIQSSKKKIRLGYFSADFHNHPTAYLIAELFECHDKEQFELIAFVFGRNAPDEMRSRLERSFDQFIDINGMTDQEAAHLSNEMQIDIAIDLKGFTKEARPGIFMHGAAPIQISYLAFPGTMGLVCFDYVIADHTLIPELAQEGMVEKVIYMPDSYQVNDRSRAIASYRWSRAELGLPQSGFVFCSFNNNYKITPAVLDGWIRILKLVEGSVLWLYADNPYAVNNLKKEVQARGLEVDRLIFADRIDSAAHLARYRVADLFLDTSPCNAHTTASDALWAGLPVLTLLGDSFGARVAASLLSAVGLSDLITNSQSEYEHLAVELATQPEKLSEIKMRLNKNLLTAPLFDTPLFTKNLEAGFRQAYSRYQQGLGPDHIYID